MHRRSYEGPAAFSAAPTASAAPAAPAACRRRRCGRRRCSAFGLVMQGARALLQQPPDRGAEARSLEGAHLALLVVRFVVDRAGGANPATTTATTTATTIAAGVCGVVVATTTATKVDAIFRLVQHTLEDVERPQLPEEHPPLPGGACLSVAAPAIVMMISVSLLPFACCAPPDGCGQPLGRRTQGRR